MSGRYPMSQDTSTYRLLTRRPFSCINRPMRWLNPIVLTCTLHTYIYNSTVNKKKRSSQGTRNPTASASTAKDIVVNVGAGAYYNTSIQFTEADSPPPGSRVTWRGPDTSTRTTTGANSAAAVVYGGARILPSSWTKAFTMTRSGSSGSGGGTVWKAALPAVLVDGNGRAIFHTLVQDERSAWLARTPNFGSGFLPCAGGNSGFTCG